MVTPSAQAKFLALSLISGPHRNPAGLSFKIHPDTGHFSQPPWCGMWALGTSDLYECTKLASVLLPLPLTVWYQPMLGQLLLCLKPCLVHIALSKGQSLGKGPEASKTDFRPSAPPTWPPVHGWCTGHTVLGLPTSCPFYLDCLAQISARLSPHPLHDFAQRSLSP